MHALWIYLGVINLLAFVSFGDDKKRARKAKRRIAEKTLLLEAVLGGAAGAWFGMYFFHHKTRKARFVCGIPIILGIQLIILYFFFRG